MNCIDTLIIRVIARVDGLSNKMINQILHHPDFITLEASWRGLYFLVSKLPCLYSTKVMIRLLTISQLEMQQDCIFQTDIEKSELFNKIYSNEFDFPGGMPFSVLLVDYNMTLHGKINWLSILKSLSKIAAAAFVCVLMGVEASFFELNNYAELQDSVHLERCFSQSKYNDWNKCRSSDDMRFINLVLPRVLWRKPYHYGDRYLQNHSFIEEINSHDDYCWGSPCYLSAAMIMQCFVKTGWFTDFKSQRLSLPLIYRSIDVQRSSPVSRLEASISERLDLEMAHCGFMSVVEEAYVYSLVHRSALSIQLPARFNSKIASMNAQVATLLPYLLCACRFAHYIKIIARDKIGSLMTAAKCEHYLQQWIYKYCGCLTTNESSQWSRYPLEDAKIQVCEDNNNSGKFLCKFDIKPNYHIEQINTNLRFTSWLNNAEAAV